MISLRMPPELLTRLVSELRRAKSREIGGVLVGEHMGPGEFRIVDLSVQRSGGTSSCFVRRPEEHTSFLHDFFERTGSSYERFNYLGEWHSHPNCSPHPSATDAAQMQFIVEEDPAPFFAILLIVRLGLRGELELNAHAFRPRLPSMPIAVTGEDGSVVGSVPAPETGWRRILRRRRPSNFNPT